MTESQSFQVHLTDEASAAFGEDPIHADEVEFYDSGAWVSHADGRDFFPYERILRIRDASAAGDAGAQESGERRAASSGTASTVDDTNLDVT